MDTCTTCADGVRRCPSKGEIVDILEMGRADLVKAGCILPKQKAMCENILADGNPFGEKQYREEALGKKAHEAKVG